MNLHNRIHCAFINLFSKMKRALRKQSSLTFSFNVSVQPDCGKCPTLIKLIRHCSLAQHLISALRQTLHCCLSLILYYLSPNCMSNIFCLIKNPLKPTTNNGVTICHAASFKPYNKNSIHITQFHLMRKLVSEHLQDDLSVPVLLQDLFLLL